MPNEQAYAPFSKSGSEFVSKLRKDTAGVSLAITRFGVRRGLTSDQVEKAAQPFGAEARFLKGSKKILDTSKEAFREVSKILGRARRYWLTMTVDFPTPGVRLIRQSLVESFDQEMKSLTEELEEAKVELEKVYGQMRYDAKQALGALFNMDDYPSSISDQFDLQWGFPNVEPDERLKSLNPKLYGEEQQKVQKKFEEAVRLAEESFATEFQKMVSHLTEVLQPGPDGEKKQIRKSAVGNLKEFISRFQTLNISGNEELNRLVSDAESLIDGVDLKELRKEPGIQANIGQGMATLQQTLDAMVQAVPARQIYLEDEPEAAVTETKPPEAQSPELKEAS